MSDHQFDLFDTPADTVVCERAESEYAVAPVVDDPWAEDETESNEVRLNLLGDQARSCTACALSQSRNKVVFGEGNPESPLVFVGEGPGQQEDASGRPFVGRAGALLDECLRECGMSRKHVYICNILKCRACLVENGRVQNRPPRIDEVDACSRWLDEQLRILNPLVIVCLGGPSANHLIHRNFRIMAERGQWFTTCRYSRYAIAALHPAFILRQEGPAYESSRRLLIDDIESARRKVIEAKKEPPVSLF
jgi:DNA polymerase